MAVYPLLTSPKLPFVRDRNGLGIPVMPALPRNLPFTPGNIWHVRPRYGSDVNASGRNPQSAFKSLLRAKNAASADQNDVVLFYGEGTDKANCSDTQAVQLDWNKDLVHLIAVNSGVSLSPRTRIQSSAAYASALPVFKLSAGGCYIQGVEIVLESTDGSCLGALEVTGSRNKFVGCHVYGFASATQDIASGYSLFLNGAEENEFVECQIGSDRLAQGAQVNSQIKVAAVSKNNRFINSVIRLCSTHATNHIFLRAPAGSLDGTLVFQNTIGVNSKNRNVGAAELTYAFVVASTAGGDVILDPTSAFQAADVNSTDTGNVYGAGASSGILIPLVK